MVICGEYLGVPGAHRMILFVSYRVLQIFICVAHPRRECCNAFCWIFLAPCINLLLRGLVDVVVVVHGVGIFGFLLLRGGSHHHDRCLPDDGEYQKGSDREGHGEPGKDFEEARVGRVVEVLRDSSRVFIPEGAGFVGGKLDVDHGLDGKHEVDQSDVERDVAQEEREIVDGVVQGASLRSSLTVLGHAKRKVEAYREKESKEKKLDREDGAREKTVRVHGAERRDEAPTPRIRAIALVVASSGAAVLIRIDKLRPTDRC